jgi:hypothetical protein
MFGAGGRGTSAGRSPRPSAVSGTPKVASGSRSPSHVPRPGLPTPEGDEAACSPTAGVSGNRGSSPGRAHAMEADGSATSRVLSRDSSSRSRSEAERLAETLLADPASESRQPARSGVRWKGRAVRSPPPGSNERPPRLVHPGRCGRSFWASTAGPIGGTMEGPGVAACARLLRRPPRTPRSRGGRSSSEPPGTAGGARVPARDRRPDPATTLRPERHSRITRRSPPRRAGAPRPIVSPHPSRSRWNQWWASSSRC